jgi:uncharacterized protein (DUF1800 family)
MRTLRLTLTLALAAALGLLAARDGAGGDFRQPLQGEDRRILHALNRLTYGPRPGDIEAVRGMGLEQWIDLQLHPERIAENPALAALLAPLETLNMSPADLARSETGTAGQAAAKGMALRRDLTTAKLYRAVYSERQLEEVLTDFWFNHFNVYLNKGAVRILAGAYERDAIRPHVLGKFRDLLGATAHSPAMLFYLDNWQSVDPRRAQQTARFLKNEQLRAKAQARGLNENYARELLELHTLGVDGGYTQKDVVEVARAFTGWTILQPRQIAEFVFNARMHDPGEKTVLGVKIPAGGGQSDGERVLDILARHPSTARFISTKLAQRFVADDPPSSLIDSMAAAFRRTDGDIRAVLAAMFASPEFFSEGAWRAKVKTPLELVVSAVRATGAEVRNAAPLAQRIAELGQPLYMKVEPTGYPMKADEWVNSAALLARMNFALALAGNRVPGSRIGMEFTEDPAEMAHRILFYETAEEMAASINNALGGRERTPALVAGLVLGSPDFQRR